MCVSTRMNDAVVLEGGQQDQDSSNRANQKQTFYFHHILQLTTQGTGKTFVTMARLILAVAASAVTTATFSFKNLLSAWRIGTRRSKFGT